MERRFTRGWQVVSTWLRIVVSVGLAVALAVRLAQTKHFAGLLRDNSEPLEPWFAKE